MKMVRFCIVTCFLLLCSAAGAESVFYLECEPSERFVLCTLVHGEVVTTTPTAAVVWASIVTNEPGAVITAVRDRSLPVKSIPAISQPLPEGDGHRLDFLSSVAELSPDAAFTSGTALVQFRVPVRALPCRIEVRADSVRGGVRAWDGTNVTPGKVLAVFEPGALPLTPRRPGL